jgi:predicted dehydrogenase
MTGSKGTMEKLHIGLIGCGNISDIYLKNIRDLFPNLEVVALANRTRAKSEAKAKEYGIQKVLETDELIKDPKVELVLILTDPSSHYPLAKKALLANKHVYLEKPLALSNEEGAELLQLANSQDRMLAVAPDTFLGGGLQLCKNLIDSGSIGDIVSVDAFMCNHGPEKWHPNPEFFYKQGGGPMLDLGPYYFTAIVNLVGPVQSVMGMTGKSFEKRIIGSEKKKGQSIQVETPTHFSGSMRFANGAIGTIIMSFDVWKAELPRIEIHGTLGSLSVPDPNTFSGPVKLCLGTEGYKEIPIPAHSYVENSRGIGLADMANSLIEKRESRVSKEMAAHVLEIMLAFEKSSDSKKEIAISSRCKAAEPFPSGFRFS